MFAVQRHKECLTQDWLIQMNWDIIILEIARQQDVLFRCIKTRYITIIIVDNIIDDIILHENGLIVYRGDGCWWIRIPFSRRKIASNITAVWPNVQIIRRLIMEAITYRAFLVIGQGDVVAPVWHEDWFGISQLLALIIVHCQRRDFIDEI